jgi:predicted transcriptional regulator
MKRKTKRVARLRRGTSDAEVVRWVKAHDVFDRLESGISEVVKDHSDLDQILEEAVLQDNTAQLNMRIPPAMKAVLSRLARERTTDATTLARIWLAERLQQELKAG